MRASQVSMSMEVAFADCVRRGLPASVLFVEVTRLDPAAAARGVDGARVRSALVELLRSRQRELHTREDEQGLLVLLPGKPAETGELVGRELVDEAKRLALPGTARVRVGLSVGFACTSGRSELFFETLELVAREGAAVAGKRGGECCVHTRLYELMQRRAEEIARTAGRTLVAPQVEPAPAVQPLDQRAAEPAAKDGSALAPADELPETGVLPATDEIDLLRRRIAKLNRALEASERALAEVTSERDVVSGIASTYREVQGLDATAPDRERKQELLRRIFAANLELQELRQASTPRPQPVLVATSR